MEDLSAFSARPRFAALLDYFAKVEDTRQAWKVMYPLREVLFLVVCGIIASGDDYDDIVDWGEAHLTFLAVVRHFALNLVRQVADKRSIKRRRKRAAWDPQYLLEILGPLQPKPC